MTSGLNSTSERDEFTGTFLKSDAHPGIRYHLKKPIGTGATGTAYFALRESAEGSLPVVLKVISPFVVSHNQDAATLLVKKEAVALGRIGERVPATPFVVKLIEAGFIPETPERRFRVPWIAIEYVHGGLEGTTLTQRVSHSIFRTRHAFGVERTMNAVRCMAGGLSAIHEVGVVHRDVTPRNVLCCGFGREELFKIADLGLARPKGMKGTFNATLLGTPGYAAPEQAFPGNVEVGPASDVFSFAAVIFFILTGEDYLPSDSTASAVLSVQAGDRKRLLDGKYLHPELREQPELCAELDIVLEHATAARMDQRLQTVQMLASSVLSLLDTQPKSTRHPQVLAHAMAESQLLVRTGAFEWQVREPRSPSRLVYHANWSSDGRCLAITSNGVEYWDGAWKWPSLPEPLCRAPICFTAVSKAGVWLLGGEEGQLAIFTGTRYEVLEPGAPRLRYLFGSGDPDDLAAFVAQLPGGPPMLCASVARRWLKPLVLPDDVTVNGLSRIGDSTWLVVGRTGEGGGFASLYDPLMWELTLVASPKQPLVCCTAHSSLGIAVAAGIGGTVLRISADTTTENTIPGATALSCIALNASGRAVVGAAGRLWESLPDSEEFAIVWEEKQWELPFISLFSDVGLTYALTPEGAVLEGRQTIDRQSLPSPP